MLLVLRIQQKVKVKHVPVCNRCLELQSKGTDQRRYCEWRVAFVLPAMQRNKLFRYAKAYQGWSGFVMNLIQVFQKFHL